MKDIFLVFFKEKGLDYTSDMFISAFSEFHLAKAEVNRQLNSNFNKTRKNFSALIRDGDIWQTRLETYDTVYYYEIIKQEVNKKGDL